MNLKGVLYTAQAAGQQMERFDNGGSIIMVGSIGGTITGVSVIPISIHKITTDFSCAEPGNDVL